MRFCSRCGHPSDELPGRSDVKRRICQRCGMGMLLTAGRSATPGEAAAFAIFDHDLTIAAVSTAGERFFGAEDAVVGTHLLEVVTSPLGDDVLARHVGQAAQNGNREPFVMPVRLVSGSSALGTLAARIATCGPPRAALVTVEPSGFGRR